MPDINEKIRLIVIIGSLLLLFFILAIVSLVIIFNKRNQLHQKEKEIVSAESKLEIQEQVFNTLSREIHDNVGQRLSLAKVQLNIIDQKGSGDRDLLFDAMENITLALTDLRDMAKSLSTDRISELGIRGIVEQELQRIGRGGFVRTSLRTEGKVKRITIQKKLVLYRIIQEALQNTLKHAQASSIEVLFNYKENDVEIKVSDNGKGFDMVKTEMVSGGLGLQNIKNRSALIGGKAIIESIVGKGTTLILSVPYE